MLNLWIFPQGGDAVLLLKNKSEKELKQYFINMLRMKGESANESIELSELVDLAVKLKNNGTMYDIELCQPSNIIAV